MRQRIVQVNVATEGPDSGSKAIFKIITNIVGFVNNYAGLAGRPNAVLQFDEGSPLDDYSLKLVLRTSVKANKETLLNYGPHFKVGQAPARRCRAMVVASSVGEDGSAPPAKRQRRARIAVVASPPPAQA